MSAVTLIDLNNAKKDVDTIGGFTNQTVPATVVNRNGKQFKNLAKSSEEIEETKSEFRARVARYSAQNIKGAHTSNTEYQANDIWKSSDNGWYVVLADYTSGADSASDIAAGKVKIYQPSEWITPFKSVDDLANNSGMYDGQQIQLLSYFYGTESGGGILKWSENRLKSEHDGRFVFSTTVPFSGNYSDYQDGIGETDAHGKGCWVRINDGQHTLEAAGLTGHGKEVPVEWEYENSSSAFPMHYESASSIDSAFEAIYSTRPIVDLSNPDAENFAWHGVYWIQFYTEMHRLTSKQKWLDYALELIDFIFENTDEKRQARGEIDTATETYLEAPTPYLFANTGIAAPAWRRPSGDYYQIIPLITGQICRGIMTFVDYVIEQNLIGSTRTKVESYIPECKKALDLHDDQYVYDRARNGSVPGAFYYKNPNNAGTWDDLTDHDGTYSNPNAYNQNMVWNVASMYVDKHLGLNQEYRTRFQKTLDFIRLYWWVDSNGRMVWRYTHDVTDPVSKIEDVNHAHLDYSYFWRAWAFGWADITEEEVTALTNTIDNWWNSGSPTDKVDGSGGAATEFNAITSALEVVELADIKTDIIRKVRAVCSNQINSTPVGASSFCLLATILRAEKIGPLHRKNYNDDFIGLPLSNAVSDADDSGALKKVFESQKKFVGNPEAVYRISHPIDVLNRNIDVDFNGATLLIDSTAAESWRMIRIRADLTDEISVTNVQYDQSTVGSKKGLIVTFSDASAYAVGDVFKLVSDDVINPYGADDERIGQIFEIVKKDNNDIYTHRSTDFRFNTNIRAAKLNKKVKCNIRNFKLKHTSKVNPNFQILLEVDGYVAPFVNNFSVEDTSAVGYRPRNCFRPKVRYAEGKNLLGDTNLNQTGYVIAEFASSDGEYGHLHGELVRHVFTTGADNHAAGHEISAYGGSCNATIQKITGRECHSFAADTHPDSYNCRFICVDVHSDSQERSEATGAVQFRGWKDYANNIVHVGDGHGLYGNWTNRDCGFGRLHSQGGRPVTIVANPSNPDCGIYNGDVTLVVDGKQVFGLSISNANLTLDNYNVKFSTKYKFISTKILMKLFCDAANYKIHIRNMSVNLKEIVKSEFGGIVPIQLLSDWDAVKIDNIDWTVADPSSGIEASKGLSVFVNGQDPAEDEAGVVRKINKLEVPNLTVNAGDHSISTAIMQMAGGLVHDDSDLRFGYRIYASDSVMNSNFQLFEVFKTDMFLMHLQRLLVSEDKPYINGMGNLETLFDGNTNGGAITSIQPPTYAGQRWRLKSRSTSKFSISINTPDVIATLAPGAEIELLGTLTGWEII